MSELQRFYTVHVVTVSYLFVVNEAVVVVSGLTMFSVSDFKEDCDHGHHLRCYMCEDLKDVMNDIRQQILESSVSMYSREYQEDLLYERYIEDLLYVIFCRIISQSSDKLPSMSFNYLSVNI